MHFKKQEGKTETWGFRDGDKKKKKKKKGEADVIPKCGVDLNISELKT